jgi:hypothetical protein
MTKMVRIMAGVFRSDQCSPCRNPEESVALNLRQTITRNTVTTNELSRWEHQTSGEGINRMPFVEGWSKKQRPPGKPADKLTWTQSGER